MDYLSGNGNGSSKLDVRLSKEPLRFKILLFLSVAGVAILFGWLGAMANERTVPVVNRGMEIKTPTVRPGTNLQVRYVLVRNKNCKVHVDRFVYDGEKQRHVLPSLDFANLPLGEDSYTVPVPIPEEAKPGRSRYTVISTYVCNPLQELWPIKGEARDVWFDIQ